MKDSTHKPHLTPTASMNPHACCLDFSSRETLSLPRCLADNCSTCSGGKYGLNRLTWDSSPLGVDVEAELGPAGDVGCVVVILAGLVTSGRRCVASSTKKAIWSRYGESQT